MKSGGARGGADEEWRLGGGVGEQSKEKNDVLAEV